MVFLGAAGLADESSATLASASNNAELLKRIFDCLGSSEWSRTLDTEPGTSITSSEEALVLGSISRTSCTLGY